VHILLLFLFIFRVKADGIKIGFLHCDKSMAQTQNYSAAHQRIDDNMQLILKIS